MDVDWVGSNQVRDKYDFNQLKYKLATEYKMDDKSAEKDINELKDRMSKQMVVRFFRDEVSD